MSREPAAIGHRILRAAFVIMFMWLFWKLGGFLMQQVISYFFGKGAVFAAFTTVHRNLVYVLFYSSLLQIAKPAFMPLFAERMTRDGESAAWDLANTVLNLLLIAAAVFGTAGFLFAPQIVATVAPAFAEATQAQCVVLLRWMIPGLGALAFAIAALAILTSYKVFSYPSAADAAQKLVWTAALFAGIVLIGRSGAAARAPHLIGSTFLVGCAAQVGVLLYGMRKQLRFYRPALPLLSWPRLGVETAHALGAAAVFFGLVWLIEIATRLPEPHRLRLEEGNARFLMLTALMGVGAAYALLLWRRGRRRSGAMARFAVLAGPLLVGAIFGRYRDAAAAFFQSFTLEESFSLIEMAKSVASLPTVLIGYALSVAMIPFLCDLAAQKREDELGRIVGRTLRFMALFFLPMAAVLLVLGEPAMRLMWDHRGAWSPGDARLAGFALALTALTIPILAWENVLLQGFFSMQETALPTWVGILFAVLHAAALYVGIQLFGLRDHAFWMVCAATPLFRGLKNLVLVVFLAKRLKWNAAAFPVKFFAHLAVVCGGMMLTSWAAYRVTAAILPLERYLPGDGGARAKLLFAAVRAVHLAPSCLAALAVFLVACWALRIEEFQWAVAWLRDRLRRRPSVPPEA